MTSININVNGGMKYSGGSYTERAEREKRCKNRLLKVREQSKEIAQELRDKVRIAKEDEIKKLQKIKEKELNEWKRNRQNQIQDQIDCCIQDFGNAHIAAINASCEESESLRERREEHDLMASVRGRVAMLSEQRRRDREAEERLQKRKQRQQKTVGIQADFLAQSRFSESNKINNNNLVHPDNEEDEEKFINKPNLHKYQSNYNPQNYTSNSIDSSSASNSIDDEESVEEKDDSIEFNQITNLLKQKMQDIYDAPSRKIAEIVDISSESSDVQIVPLPAKKVSPLKKKLSVKDTKKAPQKSILKSKKPQSNQTNKKSQKTSSKNESESNRVRYVDFRNMYETSYEPKKDLVKRNEQSRSLNAKEEAKIHTEQSNMISKQINEDILRQLSEIRSQEALEKEKIRRDYERLRLEMEELAKQENIARPLSRDQLLRQEENRQKKMNEAVEKALKKNVITCPPVARAKEKSDESTDVNVAVSSEAQKSCEINNLIKIERLKDLLEKINHQKRLILNELEKGEDVSGPNLQRVMDCLKKLEQEKATMDIDNNEKLKKIEELNERELKVREREIELENKLSELFKKQQEKQLDPSASSSSSSEHVNEGKKIVAPPVEIIIKVQPTKSPRKKKKPIKCIDTLNRQPGKVYPKTPIKKKEPNQNQEAVISNENPMEVKIKNAPSQSKSTEAPIKPILRRSLEDNSSSTSYRSIPDQLQNVNSEIPDVPLKERTTNSRKSHHKLNPALMHYITRLLGMSTNIGNQLNVDVSSVSTPGSSTINTSGNNSAINVEPSFDADRLQKLQEFIDNNYSFLKEIDETIESIRQEQINDRRMEGIWRDALNKKKPQSVTASVDQRGENRSTKSSKGSGVRNILKPTLMQDNASTERIAARKKQLHQQTSTSQQQKETSNLEDLMLKNSAEYALKCRQRIYELNQKIEQVKQEKLRLIENSLSSGEFNNFTEYREVVQPKASSERATSSQKEDPPSEEINNILQKQTRPFGVSKDSGISTIISRPVTSSDFRDSPDTRILSEENAAHVFQPIKTPKLKITSTEGENETIKDISHIIRQQQQKPQRPPLSLKSPQFEKQHEPHELSTIAEIETPTASKVNIIPHDDLTIPGVSNLHTFPNFDEYAKNLGEHQLTIQSFPDLGDLKDALPDINVQTFVDPRDYNLEESKDNDTDSLCDVMEGLKKRHIVNNSFEIIQNDDDFIEKTTPTATIQITQPQSPRRPPAQSRIFIKTPENTGNVQVEIQQTPTKKKQPQHLVPQPESPKSNDTLSGIQEIEKDLQGTGMSWGANLLKRGEEAKMRKSSSSDDKIEIQIDIPDTSSSSASGRPLNLREFLRRELMQKSRKDKYLSDESSLSSQFMRSLLNASSSSTTSDRPKSESSQNAKLRTSTPVLIKSTQTVVGGKTATSQQLFGTEAESVSTVRDASGSDES